MLIPLDQTVINTKVIGTLRYLDPQYRIIGNLIAKSDVYSFRVVLTELLMGLNSTPGGRCMDDLGISSFNTFSHHSRKAIISDIFNVNININDEAEREQMEGAIGLAKRCLSSCVIERLNTT